MSQTMQLEDIEMTQSLGFKDSSYSCRLSQKSVSPPKKMKYKCYECTGNSFKSTKCKSCHGMKQVTQSNPLVGLLLQVMSTKLGKNVHTIKQLPKLEFDHGKQPRKSSNSHHNFYTYNNHSQNDKIYQHKYKPNFSQTTSVNDSSNSNSMDNSFDSMDSSSNMSDFMNRSKQRVIKSNKNNYHNPQFRHQISEIKQQTYASQQTYTICDLCQKQGDIGADYMKCKVCHHYNICINCYQTKKNQSHTCQQSNQKPNVQMRRAVTTFTYDKPPSPVKVHSNVDIPISRHQSPLNNVSINPHHPNYNPDSFIHEHPLTRCKYNEQQNKQDSRADNSPTQVYNKNGEQIFSIYGTEIKFEQRFKSVGGSSYNIRVQKPKSISRRQSQLGANVGNYQKLFKTYDNQQQQESPQKNNKNFINKSGHYKQQLTHFETINQQRQSPSPSQKSMASSPYNHKKDSQTQSLPDINQNKYHQQSQSQVVSQQCEQKLQYSGYPQEQIEQKFGCEQTKSQKQYQSPLKSQQSQSDLNRNISMTVSHNFDNNSSTKQVNNQSYLNEHNQNNKPNTNSNNNSRHNLSNDYEIMPLQIQTQSRILESKSKSSKSNNQSFQDASIGSDKQIQNHSHKNYTQTKPKKLTSFRHHYSNDSQNSKNKQGAKDSQRQDREDYERQMEEDQVQISNFSEPIHLFGGNRDKETEELKKVDMVNLDIVDGPSDEFPLVVTVTSQKHEEKDMLSGLIKKFSQFSQQSTIPHIEVSQHEKSLTPSIIVSKQQQKNDKKICSECLQQVQNKTMFMKCQTCQNSYKSYILCASCSSNNQIVSKHSQNSYIKHSFKPQLYKKIHFNLKETQIFQDDDDWMKQDNHQPTNQHTSYVGQNYSDDPIYDTYGGLSPDVHKKGQTQHDQIKQISSQIQISNYGNTLNPSPLTKNPKLFQSAHSIEINSLHRSQNDKSVGTEKSSENQIQKQIITLSSGGAILDHANEREVSVVESYTIMNNSQSGSLKDFMWNKTPITANKNNLLTKTSNLTPVKQVTFKQSIEENQRIDHNQVKPCTFQQLTLESFKPLNIEQIQQNPQSFTSKLRNRNCSLQIDNPDTLNQQSQPPSSPFNESPSNKVIDSNRISINVGIDGQWVLPQNQVLLHNSISIIPSRVSLNNLPLTDGTQTIHGLMQGTDLDKTKNGEEIDLRGERHYDSPDKQDQTYGDIARLRGKVLIRRRSSTQQVGHESPESPFQRKNKPTKKSNQVAYHKSNQFDQIDEHSGQKEYCNIGLSQNKKKDAYESPGKIGPCSRVIVDVGESDNSQMDIQFRESSHKKKVRKSDKKEHKNQLRGNWILDQNQKPRESITQYEREYQNIMPVLGQNEVNANANGKGNGLINKSLTESQMLEEQQQQEINEKWEESQKQIHSRQTSSRANSQNNQSNKCYPISSRMQNYKGFMFPLHNSSGNTNVWKKNQHQNSPSKQANSEMNFQMKIEQSQKLQKSDDDNDNEEKQRYNDVITNDHQIYGYSQTKGKVHFNYEQHRNQQQTQPFIFQQYSCDMCAETPQNFRYHCKICKDYDLCGKCFIQKCPTEHDHETTDFEEIDKAKQLQLDKENEVQQNQKNQQKTFFMNKIVQKILPSICIKQTINRFSTNSLARSSVTRHSISYKQNSGIDSSSRLSYAGSYQSGFIPRQRGSHKF